ncbi:MAG: UdgX family uracil-DNA binding protein [Bdellovibrionaceae bacterium]|nr:UdgX family uracil-DNA binding protein [Pseudobdellovibrionaceae bacterium]
MILANFDPHFESWREEARRLLREGISPERIIWSSADQALSLFTMEQNRGSVAVALTPRVSADFLANARLVSMARDDERWSLLYRLLYRMACGHPELMNDVVDDDVIAFHHLLKSVKRDLHKMHAFVRFKEVHWEGITRYVAWHRSEHPCLREGAEFFKRRFGDKPWSIFTPDESAHWDLRELTFASGIPQHEFQVTDDFDELWKSYYASIFNPARIKIKAMKAEMAPKYWGTLPEVDLIRELVREAPARLHRMAERQNVRAEPPPASSLTELRQSALSCKACPIAAHATQTVFGEGPSPARLMIVGEQPGDQEDRQGRVFTGPAGEILNEALRAAGVDRTEVYVTNAVKHFKWRPGTTAREGGGKARVHQKPSGTEMHACRPWLEAEIALVKPDVILALGATAATSVLGRLPKLGSERGRVIQENTLAPRIVLSWHPAAILRSSSPEEEHRRKAELAADLALASRISQTEFN